MELLLKRLFKKENYTIGKLYIDGVYFCDTLEDTDRGLTSDMLLNEIRMKKIPNETAIPIGTYVVEITYSPKFQTNLPLLYGVKGFTGIRIHSGNYSSSSSGCVLVGENKIKGGLMNSKKTLEKLMEKLKTDEKNIKITIE